jgi:hypothetical protein
VIRQVYEKHTFDVVIDVAAGHSTLGAHFVISGAGKEAVVLDPAKVGSVRHLKGEYMHEDSGAFRFRHECSRTGLPAESRSALRKTSADRVLAVHAKPFSIHLTKFVSCQQMPRFTWQSCSAARKIYLEAPIGNLPPNA